MKNIKRRMELFAFYDRCGMERHLEKMAAEGWMVEKLTGFYWQYRRIEPEELRFSISYFNKASGFDSLPRDEQREYWEYCSQAGWSLAAASAQMQILIRIGKILWNWKRSLLSRWRTYVKPCENSH